MSRTAGGGQTYANALITGATSGIGRAFAHALPDDTGLLLTGRDAGKLASLAADLVRPGRPVETLAADLAEETQVIAVADWAEAAGVDLLINNAGIGRLGRIVDHSLETERNTAAVNVLAVLLLTRSLLPGMLRRASTANRRCGVIVVSSTTAFSTVPFFATYAATKAFDLSFAEALAEEMRGEPVDVLALCPGATRTDFGASAGFGGDIPGAADPATVARDGLAALGRQTVKITGLIDQAALGPMLLPRRAVTGLVGTAMRVLNATTGALRKRNGAFARGEGPYSSSDPYGSAGGPDVD